MNAQNIVSSRLPHTSNALIGREVEVARLDAAWNDPAEHVLVIRGIGGEGKTSLVGEWAARLSARKYDGASYFDWSFYSQGTRDQPGASSGPFIASALTFFGGKEGAALANSPASGRDKATKLLGYIRARRTLLILDGLEPLQYPPGPLGGRLRDEDMAVLLKGLAQNNHGLCVVTTREPVTDLDRWQRSTAPELELECLSDAAGAAVLLNLMEPIRTKGVHRVKSTLAERVEIVQGVKGHALTLRLLGGYIHKFLGDVRRWREVDYSAADAAFKTNLKSPEVRYGHAFKTIEVYERWLAGGGASGARQLAVLRMLGLFDRPATGTSVAALRAEPVIPGLTEPLVGLTPDQWNGVLSDLEECGLLTAPRLSTDIAASRDAILDAHPLMREYFARQLRDERPEAWRAGHKRLYEHLCATTRAGEKPSLEALQPLYQAVAHGCHAGLHQKACEKVYVGRIRRRGENYSLKKLGAFASDLGALACFFKAPWGHVSTTLTEVYQAWLLSEAAFCLRGLGRLAEAVQPMRAGLAMRVQQENWKNAAIVAGNLSELELALGDMAAAVAQAERAVDYADRSGDEGERKRKRTTHADALHQAGRRNEAETLFRESENMQAVDNPEYPFLHSLSGFRYCDLLLGIPERTAWVPWDGSRTQEELRTACLAVAQRAKTALEVVLKGSHNLLDIALNHLTLGRAPLFEAILDHTDLGVARAELDAAVSGLRQAGDATHLPRGLLTRAWLRALTGPRTGAESAQEDLDEAWEIAERGPMPLFLADIHLYRARLFAHETPYPWHTAPDGTPRGPKDDLADARRLIVKHGYGRRTGELEDAEAASKDWPDAARRPAPLELPPKPAGVPHPALPVAPEVPMPAMTGPEIEALREAFLSAFSQDSFDQMLLFRLNKNRAAEVGGGAFGEVTFDLIRLAVREGWAGDLIRAARKQNPGNPTLKQFCADHPHLVTG